MAGSKRKTIDEVMNMTPEAERSYFESIDPIRQGKEVRPVRLKGASVLSYFAVRVYGGDIDRLADLARKKGMKPSELARLFIVQGLDQAENAPSLEHRVTMIEKEVARLASEHASPTRRARSKEKEPAKT